MKLPGRYRLVGTRNLTLLNEEFAASQNRRLRESRCGGDFSAAPTVMVNGTTKFLLAYAWLAGGDGDAVDAFAAADVVAPAAATRQVLPF